VPTVLGVDRSYVKQGKDPETGLRLSERPDLQWIRFVIDSYGEIATGRRRQLSVSGDRLQVHAQADEVAEHLLPDVLAAVERANERYGAFLDERAARRPAPLQGEHGAAIAQAFDAIDDAIAREHQPA
jgi:hypothetical protein